MTDTNLYDKLLIFLTSTKRKPEARSQELIRFAEEELTQFIRCYFNAEFVSIWEMTDHNAYKKMREEVSDNPAAEAENDAKDGAYTENLKYLAEFYDSKIYKGKQQATLTEFEKEARKAKQATSKTKAEPTTAMPDPLAPADEGEPLTEGRVQQVTVTRHERNPRLRQLCLQHYGYVCQVCGMNFEQVYGEIGKEYIEVHHLNPIADTDGEHALDPHEGLVPLCSNCHSMIHRGGRDGKPLTLEKLKTIYNAHNAHK